MANPSDRLPENVPGKFYVDNQCIDCDLCRETAPGFFKRNDEAGRSFVFAQPQTEEDIQQCMEALEGCPVEAIGNDGEGAEPVPA
jgi:ferredoxin